jgi:hypothetical protein
MDKIAIIMLKILGITIQNVETQDLCTPVLHILQNFFYPQVVGVCNRSVFKTKTAQSVGIQL